VIDLRSAALEALDDEDFPLAERHLRALLSEEPDDATGTAVLALVVAAQERFDEATEIARRAVEIDPSSAYARWAHGDVLVQRHRFAEAIPVAVEAIRLAPDDSDNHALLARALGGRERWGEALAAAERGLELDPEHVPSASMRALALRQLGRTAEAEAAFAEVASAAPLSPFANAGQAWGLLRRGAREDALEQFREALRLDPTNEWARDGMLAALKARNPVYRLVLRYYLWIGTRTRRQQLFFALAGIFLYNTIRRIARANPEVAPLLWPLMGAYVLFLFGSWIADPLFDLLLRFDPVGRRALTRDRRRASLLVGLCLLTAVTAGVAAAIWPESPALTLAIGAAFLLIPVGGTFQCEPGWPRTVMGSYTALLAIALFVSAVAGDGAGGIGLVVVILGAAIGSWLAQWLGRFLPTR
jgi:tetratricopeptide (TPR) repeat protein